MKTTMLILFLIVEALVATVFTFWLFVRVVGG